MQVRVEHLGRPKIAIRWPCTVARYGVKACAALAPMPDDREARGLRDGQGLRKPRPAAVLAVVVRLGDERDVLGLERGERGRRRVEDELLGLRSVQAPEISADSKFVIEMSAPAISAAMSPSSAVRGRSASRTASGPSKCTSPPNARVTGLPSPRQAGESGEPFVPAGLGGGAAVRWRPTDSAPHAPPGVAAPPVPIRFLTIRTAPRSSATSRAPTAPGTASSAAAATIRCEECTTRR